MQESLLTWSSKTYKITRKMEKSFIVKKFVKNPISGLKTEIIMQNELSLNLILF